jgi:hypothetical protein
MTTLRYFHYERHIKTKGGKMKIPKRIYRTAVFIPLFLCAIIVFWGFQVSAKEWTDAQKEVWKSVEIAWDGFKHGKMDATASVEGSIEWLSDQPEPYGGFELTRIYEGWFNWDKPVSYELKPLEILIYGNVANVFYEWKWKGTKAGDSGRQIETFVKQDKKWKYLGGMGCSCELPIKCP